MNMDSLMAFLGWASIFNLGMFFFYTTFFRFGRAWIFKYHGAWTKVKEDDFNMVHYSNMQTLKTLILFFNIVPYLVLRMMM